MFSEARFLSRCFVALCLTIVLSSSDGLAIAQTDASTKQAESVDVSIADGALAMKAPGNWEVVKPRFRMIEAEFKLPKSEGEADDARDGRLTIMGAMGSVEQNLSRWYGQYSQPDGKKTADVAKIENTKVNGMDVTWVDITGTLLDRPGGPMAGGKLVERENYRTLAAIVQTGDHGQYFIKCYGPGKTMADNEKAFKAFVGSLSDPKAEVADAAEAAEIKIAKGAMTMKAPASWETVKPRFRMIEAEFKIPKSEGEIDEARDGRLTIMGAMGSVEQNLNRWYGQYKQPDGKNTADVAKITEAKINNMEVTWVDITGTLLDRPGGPMAGGKLVERENYRTLAAIVQTGELGQYFIKLYGPGKTISDNEKAFKSFVESITIDAEKIDL